MIKPASIIYASGSPFKQEEVEAICRLVRFPAGTSTFADRTVGDLFRFEFRKVPPREVLERNLETLVYEKAKSAYKFLQVPCIVEHAGLVFIDLAHEHYPGGLTQPMWDALGADRFIAQTAAANRETIARAVIGYCDGMSIKTFVGETRGRITESPRGTREFYWDPVFQPIGLDGKLHPMTYAEIATDATSGLDYKVQISQSTKAMFAFLMHRLSAGSSLLFPDL
jgi:inosine/xanthosine triphosphate pyrophosphatase family protein